MPEETIRTLRVPDRQGLARLWTVVVLVLLFFFLAVNSLVGDSPTMDEQNHIARGLAFLRTGDPRLSLEHPPLINTLSALPLLTMPELRLPTDHPSWERREGWYEFADLFLWQYNHDVTRIVFLSRLPIVLLTLALGMVGYLFAGRLWGASAALASLALFLFEPNIMAHGRYATTDMGGTLFTFLTTYLLWRFWQRSERWNWWLWVAVVVAMGMAFGSKLSSLGFSLIWLLLAVLPLYHDAPGQFMRGVLMRLVKLSTAGIVSLVVVWVIFGFEWGNFNFIADALLPLNQLAGPMPTFWEGLEQVFLLSDGRSTAFLLGRFSESGWIGYFPVAFLVKTPIVLIALLVVAAILLVTNKNSRRSASFLLVTGIAFYALAMQSALNIGYRHALPALPYFLLLISGLATAELEQTFRGWLTPRRSLAGGILILIGVALWIHPHYLSYFNLFAGGPSNGYRVLTDSNVDWGQDLLRLKTWMSDNEIDTVKLGWFGTADPDYYAIDYEPLPGLGRDKFYRLWWEPPFDPSQPEPGVYAISASSLWEPPLRVDEKLIYAWFRGRVPDDRIGYSILVYRVE